MTLLWPDASVGSFETQVGHLNFDLISLNYQEIFFFIGTPRISVETLCDTSPFVDDWFVMPCFSTEGDSCEFGSQKYLILCGFGGILSCGTTHTAVVPLDLVKCRLQVCLCDRPVSCGACVTPALTQHVTYCVVMHEHVCAVFLITDSGDSCAFGSTKYYALCGFGGILSCGLTHTAVVPLDLVKCRLQVCITENLDICRCSLSTLKKAETFA